VVPPLNTRWTPTSAPPADGDVLAAAAADADDVAIDNDRGAGGVQPPAPSAVNSSPLLALPVAAVLLPQPVVGVVEGLVAVI